MPMKRIEQEILSREPSEADNEAVAAESCVDVGKSEVAGNDVAK